MSSETVAFGSGPPPSPPPSEGNIPLPDSNVVIHIVNHASQLPPEFLNPSTEKQLVIGFDCEGIDLSRRGALCIMQLAFPNAVYLVDAVQGGEALVQACKPALESSHVIKVIHDCKRDSEALFFQFGIKLHNVFDTQIAYYLIEEQEGKKRTPDDYISFVSLLADRRYYGKGLNGSLTSLVAQDENSYILHKGVESVKTVLQERKALRDLTNATRRKSGALSEKSAPRSNRGTAKKKAVTSHVKIQE